MYCHKCGKQNSDAAKFCAGCGTELATKLGTINSKEKSISPKIVVLTILSIVVLAAILSNPSEDAHKSAVAKLLKQSAYGNVLETASTSGNEYEIAGSALGYSLGASFLDKIIDMGVTRTNYILFSTTEFNYQGESRTVGYGVFGRVTISDRIRKGMQK
ncbi:MAG: zinc-ribbon domain-containing protein [Candidatus Marinimicrobia bacterium]|nr:zinc-ribbon domain-containing protein [Candidatus Neomarinimicrobiota bacterium]